jgi:Ca2+-binding RTX toxin-like protein
VRRTKRTGDGTGFERRSRGAGGLMIVAMTAALILGSGVALANTVPCPGGQDVAVLCAGKHPGEYASQGSDTVNGSELKDLGRGQGGDDFVFGNGDADHVYGDDGDDQVSGGAAPPRKIAPPP